MQDDALRREIVEVLPALRRFAYALTGARHDADDLLQATVERLLVRGAPRDAVFAKWAFRVCRNMWIDELRSKKVRAAVSDDSVLDGAHAVDGERIMTAQITFAQVNQAMGALPTDQRAALALVALEGFTYAETAEILGAPIGTVMSRIARARQSLVKALEPRTAQTPHIQGRQL